MFPAGFPFPQKSPLAEERAPSPNLSCTAPALSPTPGSDASVLSLGSQSLLEHEYLPHYTVIFDLHVCLSLSPLVISSDYLSA